MMTKGFGMGFFGRGHFDKEARAKFREEWSNMTDSEKLDFMDKRMNAMSDDPEHFSIEAIDVFCMEWMRKTPEEKEQFIHERKKAFKERMACMGGFFGHNRFGFGFDPQKEKDGSYKEQFQ
ncbi:MAG: hypothetical protein LBV74_06405 [Tannerella sp.]|jgi:hypothetical protein|nr:hypothetical protein [Tannerella sp.]